MPSNEPELDDFEAWARELRGVVTAAKRAERSKKPLHVAETVYGALRLACYRYYRRLKREGLLDALLDFLTERDPGRWHRHPGDGVDWVLRLIETRKNRELLTAPRRGRIANEFRLADRYSVSSGWLLPFLYEAGNEHLVMALLEGKAPGWVKKYHSASRVSKAAGPIPAQANSNFRQLSNQSQ